MANKKQDIKKGTMKTLDFSLIQKALRYAIALLSVVMLASLLFGIIKITYTNETTDFFTGSMIAFGQKFEGVENGMVTEIASNWGLVIAYFAIIVTSYFVLVDLKENEFLKKIVVTGAYSFIAVLFTKIPSYLVNSAKTQATLEFSTFGKILLVVSFIQVAICVVDTIIHLIAVKESGNKKYKDIAVGFCSVIALISLFVGVAQISSSSALQIFTGSNLAFGITLEKAVLSVSELKTSGVVIAAYACILVGAVLSFVNLGKHEKYKQLFVVLAFAFATCYFWTLPSYAFPTAASKSVQVLTAYGILSSVCVTVSLILSVHKFLISNGKEDLIRLSLAGLGLVGVLTIFLPTLGAHMIVSDVVYSKYSYSAWELIFGDVEYASSGVTSGYLIVSYILFIVGSLTLVPTIKQRKLQYFVSFVILTVGVVFFVLSPAHTFEATANSRYYFGFLTDAGIAALILSIVPAVCSLYLTAKTPVSE